MDILPTTIIDFAKNETMDSVENITRMAPFQEHVIPMWRQIVWIVLFLFVSLVGTVGNFVVVWIVLVHKNMRTVTNFFLVNLSIADGLVAALNVPFVSYQMIYSKWHFGIVYCKINEGVASMTIVVSVITLAMISLDRYMAIMYPFKKRMGKPKTLLVIVLMWLISLVVAAPTWIFAKTGNYISPNGQTKSWCGQMWPRADLVQLYMQGFMFFTYFLPLLCMSFTYCCIAVRLWGSPNIGELTQIQLKKELAKKKVVKMMVIVVAAFAICWLPFHSFFIIITNRLIRHWPVYKDEIYLACFWFAMSNSMLNPIIYCWMSARFRAGFKKAFQFCPLVAYDSILNEAFFVPIASRKSVTGIENTD